MHLIVMTDAAQGCPAPEPPQDSGHLQALLERWNPLMTRLVPGWALQEEAEALNTLAERAQAQILLGRSLNAEEDGVLPLEAWARACNIADMPDTAADANTQAYAGQGAGTGARTVAPAPCARLTPFHGLVGSDRITLVPPAELQLSEAESRELFSAVQPLFASEHVGLQWRGPLHWRVEHESLAALPSASLARAEGDSVQRWQGRTPLAAARLLRRLQNEAQMVLHDHPVNRARAERGALAVNSLWLDHAGAAGRLKGEPSGAALHDALQHITIQALTQANAALQAWVDAALSPSGHAPNGHSNSEPTLVLCGRHAAQAFTMRRIPSGWRGAIERTLKRPPRTLPLSAWLQQMDTPADGTSS